VAWAERRGARAQLARVRLDEARNNSQDARRKGLPRHRWEADARKWEAVAEDASSDARRWEDDARRAEKDIKEMAREIKERQAGLVKLEREVVAWERELVRRSAIGQGLTATRQSMAGAAPKLLQVTAQATEALKSVLDSTNRNPDQAFRLTAGKDGGVSLALDVQRTATAWSATRAFPCYLWGPTFRTTLWGRSWTSASPRAARRSSSQADEAWLRDRH
jgi:hypothetical protein